MQIDARNIVGIADGRILERVAHQINGTNLEIVGVSLSGRYQGIPHAVDFNKEILVIVASAHSV